MDQNKSFTADSLRKSTLHNQEIQSTAFDIIRSLNMEIKEAHEAGASYIDTTIANTFAISYTKSVDAKREIYYMILSNFISRKFRVLISESEANTRILVAWFTIDDISRIEQQNVLIEYCKKPFKKRTTAETQKVISSLNATRKKNNQLRAQANTDANSDADNVNSDVD